MLVLYRRFGEAIMIGDNIKVILLEPRDNGARIGIEAPKEVPVHRREIYDAIKRAEAKKK